MATVPTQQPKAQGQNVWMIISIVLAVILVAGLGYTYMKTSSQSSSGMTPLTADQASKDLVSFINEVYGVQVGTATLKGVTEENGLYKIVVSIAANGQPTDQTVYVTRDGKLFIPQVVNVADITTQYRDYQAQQKNQPAANTNVAVPTPTDSTTTPAAN